MNRLTHQIRPLNSLDLSRFPATATATVVTHNCSLRRVQTGQILHRFARFPHQNPMEASAFALYATRAGNSDPSYAASAKMNSTLLESSVADEPRGEREAAASGNAAAGERIEPPEAISRTVLLTCESTADTGSCDVYLVGTAHVSKESCREVEAVIRFLKPEVVFLELCSDRTKVLTMQGQTALKVPTFGEMIQMWKKEQNTFGILYSWFLVKVASQLEVFPGSEFRVASEEAKACGAKVILGDRPVQVTLQRTWRKMPLWHKAKLAYSLIFPAVFVPSPLKLTKMLKELEDVDMVTLAIQEMGKAFPTLMETLVHERDQYMASMLHKCASKHSSVVAVVGRAHLQGIKKHWQQPVSIEELLEIPKPRSLVSVLKTIVSLGAAATGAAIVSGIVYLSRKK